MGIQKSVQSRVCGVDGPNHPVGVVAHLGPAFDFTPEKRLSTGKVQAAALSADDGLDELQLMSASEQANDGVTVCQNVERAQGSHFYDRKVLNRCLNRRRGRSGTQRQGQLT